MTFNEMMKNKNGTFYIKELNKKVILKSCKLGKYLTLNGRTALDLSEFRGMSYNYIKL